MDLTGKRSRGTCNVDMPSTENGSREPYNPIYSTHGDTTQWELHGLLIVLN